MLLLLIVVALLMALTGCSQRAECPKQVYPQLHAIEKIPHVQIVVAGGRMDRNSTKKAFQTIKALRVSEHYYFTTLGDYTKEFK